MSRSSNQVQLNALAFRGDFGTSELNKMYMSDWSKAEGFHSPAEGRVSSVCGTPRGSITSQSSFSSTQVEKCRHCRFCGSRIGVFFGVKGFGIRLRKHEEKCMMRGIPNFSKSFSEALIGAKPHAMGARGCSSTLSPFQGSQSFINPEFYDIADDRQSPMEFSANTDAAPRRHSGAVVRKWYCPVVDR